MGEKKRKENAKPVFVFGKKNYKFMFIGLACIALGFHFDVWWRKR